MSELRVLQSKDIQKVSMYKLGINYDLNVHLFTPLSDTPTHVTKALASFPGRVFAFISEGR